MPTARLPDGREVDASSEEWRHVCEARAILDLRTLAERRAHLEAVEQRRGKESADRLRVTMKALWEADTARRSTPTG
ncbi:MAG: hypothetical protein ACK5QX_12560 [bacterium]|jgi:hypothetical protein